MCEECSCPIMCLMLLPEYRAPILPDHLKWRIIPIDLDQSVEGWIAGPLVSIAAHWSGGRSLPCRRIMTDGALTCPCEDTPMSVRGISYCPLVDKIGERYVIILSATVAARVGRMARGTPVRFTRPPRQKRPLFVTVLPDTHLGSDRTKAMRQAAIHDIGEYLLHVWQDRPLCEAFGVEYRPACGVPAAKRKPGQAA